MASDRIVVIGASAGGIEALRDLAGALPADFPAPICVVVHVASQAPDVLGAILNRSGPLKATSAGDGEHLEANHIYVAPPDHHLLVERGIARVTRGPRENRVRPAIDPLFRSAARAYGSAAIAVVLTGNLDDGAAGLWTVKQRGGIAIVQDPGDALFPSMPRNATNQVQVDHSVALSELGPLLVTLVRQPAGRVESAAPGFLDIEVKIAMEHDSMKAGVQEIGDPSSFACPECHGVLLKLKEGGSVRFRCHTGHAYSPHTLLAAIAEGIEESLWSAVRVLEEGKMLIRTMGAHVETSHDGADAKRLIAVAEHIEHDADVIRKVVTHRPPLLPDT